MLEMAKLTFVGGIIPMMEKDLSKDKPIQDVPPKGKMVYPLSQHIGAPANPSWQRRPGAGGTKDSGKWWLRVGTPSMHLCRVR